MHMHRRLLYEESPYEDREKFERETKKLENELADQRANRDAWKVRMQTREVKLSASDLKHEREVSHLREGLQQASKRIKQLREDRCAQSCMRVNSHACTPTRAQANLVSARKGARGGCGTDEVAGGDGR